MRVLSVTDEELTLLPLLSLLLPPCSILTTVHASKCQAWRMRRHPAKWATTRTVLILLCLATRVMTPRRYVSARVFLGAVPGVLFRGKRDCKDTDLVCTCPKQDNTWMYDTGYGDNRPSGVSQYCTRRYKRCSQPLPTTATATACCCCHRPCVCQ